MQTFRYFRKNERKKNRPLSENYHVCITKIFALFSAFQQATSPVFHVRILTTKKRDDTDVLPSFVEAFWNATSDILSDKVFRVFQAWIHRSRLSTECIGSSLQRDFVGVSNHFFSTDFGRFWTTLKWKFQKYWCSSNFRPQIGKLSECLWYVVSCVRSWDCFKSTKEEQNFCNLPRIFRFLSRGLNFDYRYRWEQP